MAPSKLRHPLQRLGISILRPAQRSRKMCLLEAPCQQTSLFPAPRETRSSLQTLAGWSTGRLT